MLLANILVLVEKNYVFNIILGKILNVNNKTLPKYKF